MEQARKLAASEASPDWYARGQDWALADALAGGLPLDWTAGDIARAFAAGAQAAEQVASVELSDTATRSGDHLRQAIKAEAAVEAMQARQAELLAVLARLCELNAAERPMARVWSAAQALVDSYQGADARKPCTCDGAGRGPGRACVVKAGGRLGDLWRCADGLGA